MVNVYIVDKLDNWSNNLGNDFTKKIFFCLKQLNQQENN